MFLNDPRLGFDADRHAYTWDGQPQSGTTSVLHEAGLVDDRYFTDECKVRGRHVHECAMLHFDEDLRHETIRPEYRGYVEGIFRFTDQCRPVIHHSEFKICDPLMGYAGQGDLICSVNMLHTGAPAMAGLSELALGDIKTGVVPRASVGPQTAAYARVAAHALGVPYLHRFCLNVTDDGQFEVIWLEDLSDEDDFLAALRMVHRRRRYGLTHHTPTHTV